MTIGDYWGVEKYHSGFDPKDGVSVILINTERGAELFERIKDEICFEPSDALYATERNSLSNDISEGYVKMPEYRDDFFRTLRSDGWKKADKKYLSLRKKMIFKQRAAKMIYRIRSLFK